MDYWFLQITPWQHLGERPWSPVSSLPAPHLWKVEALGGALKILNTNKAKAKGKVPKQRKANPHIRTSSVDRWTSQKMYMENRKVGRKRKGPIILNFRILFTLYHLTASKESLFLCYCLFFFSVYYGRVSNVSGLSPTHALFLIYQWNIHKRAIVGSVEKTNYQSKEIDEASHSIIMSGL